MDKWTYKLDEIKEHWADYLEDRGPEYLRDMDLLDMHNEAFNESYFIVGTLKAEQWLGDHVFEAIRTIQNYENDNFGEMFTDLSDPERVVNMYAYIIGEQVVHAWGAERETLVGVGA